MNADRPVVIQAALSGSSGGKELSPHLPVSVAENVAAGLDAWRAGATVLHIHAREEDGTPSQRLACFEPIVRGLREGGCEAILNLSTGSAGDRSHGAERYECLALEPEMASYDCGSVNMGDRVFANSLPFLRDLAREMNARGIRPEIECFDAGHIHTALRLRKEGLLSDPLHFQFVLGVKGGADATPEQLMYMRSLMPADATWSVCAVGAAQLETNLLGALLGGQVRTGLEDNLYLWRGEYASSNAALVARIAELLRASGMRVATTAEARTILSLPPRTHG